MDLLTLGVMARSVKENEHRLPIHPDHLSRVPDDLRARIYLERGYGERFGATDDQLADLVGGVLDREQLVERCDVVLQPKPVHADLHALRTGQVLWGWPHCVQDAELTQIAIDKKLTLIAFEVMNHWNRDGSFGLHVFHKNNELAGYCSVLHALQISGRTSDYGRRLTAVVIGFGATARGAVTALRALGVLDIDVLTTRQTAAVASPIHAARIVTFASEGDEPRTSHVAAEDGEVPIAGFLAGHDLIVNCVLQDPESPLTFMTEADVEHVEQGTVVVDVSCDEGMGFSWARPTTFEDPTFVVADRVLYYAVDHSPSYLWNSATWEISEALLPFLDTVMRGPEAWNTDTTVRRAIEIRAGVLENPAIASFQGRSSTYPHELIEP